MTKKLLVAMLAAGLLAGGSVSSAATPPPPEIKAFNALSRASSGAGVIRIRSDEEDPEETGACIHTVSSLQVCNDITRRWCITGGLAKANFYPGETCDSLKRQGLYSRAPDPSTPSG